MLDWDERSRALSIWTSARIAGGAVCADVVMAGLRT